MRMKVDEMPIFEGGASKGNNRLTLMLIDE